MSSTLLQVRQAMLSQEPMLGRVETIASLAAQSVTVTVLATGTVGAQRYSEKWILRPQAADAANRAPRLSSNYNSATGAITHAGAAYTDTTATGEQAEIHEYEPYKMEDAIQAALAQTRFVDTTYLQGRADGRYTFQNCPWIAQPSDVWKISPVPSRILTNNRRFEQWGTVSAAGKLQPDSFALAGASATFTRSSTSRSGQYSLSVTRAGTNATVGQAVQAVTSGIAGEAIRGGAYTGVLVCETATASSAFVRVTSEKADGTVLSTTDSSFHTGGGSWEELTAEHTVHASADVVRVQGILAVDGTTLMDDLYGVSGQVSDTERRGRYDIDWMQGSWDQNPLVWWGPFDWNSPLAVRSRRPFPTFDATRVSTGAADSDLTDCDLQLLTFRALSQMFDALAHDHNGNATLVAKAADYAQLADDLAGSFLADHDEDQPGARLFSGIAYGIFKRMR